MAPSNGMLYLGATMAPSDATMALGGGTLSLGGDTSGLAALVKTGTGSLILSGRASEDGSSADSERPIEVPVFTATSMLSGALTLNVGDVVNRIQLSQGADFVTVNTPEAAPDIDAVSSE
jgi:hypothetical protein